MVRGPAWTSPRAVALLATLWTLALVHFIRYPHAALIYFTYVAPLAVLAVAGVLSTLLPRSAAPADAPSLPDRLVPAVVGAFYALFFLIGPNRGGLFGPLPPEPERELALDRARIAVPVPQAGAYERIVEVVRARSRSPYIYVTPDAPEVYFLSGLENPTRTLFEIFEGPGADADSLLQTLGARDVSVVVVNTRPSFSELSPEVEAALQRAYPHFEQIGRFVVRWQGEGGAAAP
jgi:hypothetical protein